MAYTKIFPITVRVHDAIDYGINDKVVFKPADNSSYNDVENVIDYSQKDKILDIEICKTISSGINCTPSNAKEIFKIQQDRFKQQSRRKDINLAYHLIQTFDKKVDVAVAHEIGRKLAQELYGEYCCVVSTHDNTDYTHNHIIINAWNNVTGKKYNDCLKTKREIRRTSDKLCEEYGLDVLESTRNMNLIKYKDENGVTRFWEKTERKVREKEKGYTNNDYRKSNSYVNSELYRKNNREIIKDDIDKILPYVKSYEELLDNLRDIGYEIKDKTSNGEWRVHISFKAPMQEKFTRDSSIGGEDVSYTRIALMEKIKENQERNINPSEIGPAENIYENVKYFERASYKSGEINIDDIDLYYRKKKKSNDTYSIVKRSEIEKEIISDIKAKNKTINIEIKELGRLPVEPKGLTESDKYTQYMVDRINANLRTLNFVEERNIQSFKQINDDVERLYTKRNMIFSNLKSAANMMKKLNESVVLIDKYNTIKNIVEEKQGVEDNLINEAELQDYQNTLRIYERMLERQKLKESNSQAIFISKMQEFRNKYNQMGNELKNLNSQLKAYDDCVYNISVIDKNNDRKYTKDVEDYNKIKKEYKISGKQESRNERR